MLIGLLTLHFIACIALIIFAAFKIRRGVTLLNMFVPFFVVCCCLGVNFFAFFAEFLPPVQYSDVALRRLVVANLIFIGCAAIALQVETWLMKKRDPASTDFKVIAINTEMRWLIMIGSGLITLFLAVWLMDVGEFENPFAAYKETGGSGQYYKYRQLVDQDVVGTGGQGSWTAKKLTLIVGPFMMILLAYLFFQTRNWVYLALLVIQAFCGIMAAGILAHKSYLLVALFAPVLAVLIWKIRSYSMKIVLPVLAVVLTLGGTLIFQATLNSTFGFALGSLVTRALLVPAFTPIYYYEVVPDALPYRGVIESLYINHIRAPTWDYAIYDVAYHATGRAYGANANFLAVAYTGSGFLGVFWVAALCLALVLLVDYFLARLEPDHRIVAVCCSGFGFIGITSIYFLGAIENGFLIGSLIFIALCRGKMHRSDSDPVEAPLSLSHGNASA